MRSRTALEEALERTGEKVEQAHSSAVSENVRNAVFQPSRVLSHQSCEFLGVLEVSHCEVSRLLFFSVCCQLSFILSSA